ncbi:MAG: metal-dependent hydrolase [Aeoliella sp.]
MADFRTHVTTSSVLGVGYAGMGIAIGMPIETSLVAGGLCGVSGMLPDLDSDSGIPIRESTGFAAALVPMLLVDRFQAVGMPYDRMVLLTASLYFLIRFAGASLLGRFTVHRGMFHSIPAALIFAGLAFLICGCVNVEMRYFKSGAVFFGVMSHLLLDELYSVEWKGGSWRLKKSSGTALKLWGKNGWANFSTYAKLAVVAVLITGEPSVMRSLESRNPELAEKSQRVHGYLDGLFDKFRGTASPEETATEPPATNAELPLVPINSTSPWQANPWQTNPNAQSAPVDGFRPNAGTLSPGSAQPVYRADGGYAPR